MAALDEKTGVEGKDVWIVGAGGAARAVGFGIVSKGGKLTVVNRDREKGEQLAEDLGADFLPFSGLGRLRCEVLINTTPLGMIPDTHAMPVNPAGIEQGMVVMDITDSQILIVLVIH